MLEQFIVSAVGANRPGIVAQVAREIYHCGCNFEDSRMNFLGIHFSLMILVTGDRPGLYEALQESCRKLSREGDLNVSVFKRTVRADAADEVPTPDYDIRVRGEDRMGIVYRTSQLLAALNVNIVEMETVVEAGEEEQDTQAFSMRIKAAIPRTLSEETLQRHLEALSEEIEETVTITPIRAE
ncbi:MAG: glycine cleavage system protein R [Desulfosudaceae bacterium]